MLGKLSQQKKTNHKRWIRGVNLGGWLVQERWISPFQFALTDCHVRGDLCWYPGQLGAPKNSNARTCDVTKCKPLRWRNNTAVVSDFPKDESTLSAAFENRSYAEQWFETHFDNFLRRDDLLAIKRAGLTHVRVPIPHWILGDITDNEVWIDGNRWKYFRRMCKWCREIGLEVWPDIHTAPGSQNGFDNSGIAKPDATCWGWEEQASNVQRSLAAIHSVTRKIVEEGLNDVVTGFGLLNEPFFDCYLDMYDNFVRDGLTLVRANMGPDVHVFVSDLFKAQVFNNNSWWLDPERYKNTLLDSHYYHAFKPAFREMSPRQHIAYACLPEPESSGGFDSCCYQDAPNNSIPSTGVQRIVTEFSAAYDTSPGDLLEVVLDQIAANGTAFMFQAEQSQSRKEFLRNFIEAQIVAYEAKDLMIGTGWFYWSFKIEGGAFSEWDLLRGQREGWFPKVAPPDMASEDVYGSCHDILLRTNDDTDVVQPYPPVASNDTDDEIVFDDDLVVTHGDALIGEEMTTTPAAPSHRQHGKNNNNNGHPNMHLSLLVMLVALCVWVVLRRRNHRYRHSGYTVIEKEALI